MQKCVIYRKIKSVGYIVINVCVFILIFFCLKKVIVPEFADLRDKFASSSFSSGFAIDPNVVELKARIKTLNRQMPDFEILGKVALNQVRYKEHLLDAYKRYYQRVVEYMPGVPEAWGLLGYVYHFDPDHLADAIDSYQKAIYLNPHFFWFYHNIGLLYYGQGNYEKAAGAFESALQQDFGVSSKFIASSRYVYKQVLSEYFKFSKTTLQDQFQKGYNNSIIMLLLSYDELAQYEKVIPLALKILKMEDPDREIAYFYLAKATFNLQQYARSIVFCQACLKSNPQNTDALQYLALSLKAVGNDKAALQTLKQMVILLKAGKEKISQFDSVPLELY